MQVRTAGKMKHSLAFGLVFLASVGSAQAAGSTVSYTYDSQGRLVTATYVSGSTTTVVAYNYDAAGNRTTVVTAN
jgi:YD repeat-containing protein